MAVDEYSKQARTNQQAFLCVLPLLRSAFSFRHSQKPWKIGQEAERDCFASHICAVQDPENHALMVIAFLAVCSPSSSLLAFRRGHACLMIICSPCTPSTCFPTACTSLSLSWRTCSCTCTCSCANHNGFLPSLLLCSPHDPSAPSSHLVHAMPSRLLAS